MPPAARRGTQGPPAPLTPWILLGGVIGAVAAVVYGWPGFPVLYAAVIGAAWAVTPPVLTGPKDSTGRLRANGAAEQKKEDQFVWLKQLQTATLLPGPNWGPYKRPVIVVGAALALLASAMPAPDWRWMVANMVCAYLLAPVVAGAKRDVTGSPGVPWSAVKDVSKGAAVAFAVLGAILAVGVSVAFRIGLHAGPVDPDVRPWWLPAWLIVGVVAALTQPVSKAGLEHWREILAARAEWAPRWLEMKVDPAPVVMDTQQSGPARVDTISVTAAAGAADRLFKLIPQIHNHVGRDKYVSVLSCPVEQDGQPVPGTVDGGKVQVISWPMDAWPEDGVGADVDPDAIDELARLQWAQLWTRAKQDPAPVHLASRFVGSARLDTFRCPPGRTPAEFPLVVEKSGSVIGPGVTSSVLPFDASLSGNGVDFTVVSWPPNGRPDIFEPDVPEDVLKLFLQCGLTDVSTTLALPSPVVTDVLRLTSDESAAVWQVSADFPGGSNWATLHGAGAVGMLAGRFNAPTLIDARFNSRAGAAFTGAIGSDVTYTERLERQDAASHLANVQEIDTFHTIMSEVSKMGASIPILQPAKTAREALPNGTELTYRVHLIYAGLDALEFATAVGEKKFASAVGTSPIGAPKLASIMPFLENGKDRHLGAFATLIATGPVYASLDLMPPEASNRGPGRPGAQPAARPARPMRGRGGGLKAQTWMAQALLNRAFDAAKMPRVDILRLRALTTAAATKHIWEAEVRLYGVTVASIRSRTEQFAQALSVPYFRVRSSREGYATFYMGADPVVITEPETMLARPATDVALLSSLSWEYGFLSAKVTGAGGALPTVIKAEPMASNPKIIETTVTLPPGLSKGDVSGAVTKLRPATGFAFIDVRGTDDPSVLVLLSCEGDPMPFPAKFDYQAVIDAGPVITPFGVGADGSVASFNPLDDPHLLFLGLSNSGKSVAAQVLLTSILGKPEDEAHVYVIDPTKEGADFQLLEPWLHGSAYTMREAVAMLRGLYEVNVERRADNSAYEKVKAQAITAGQEPPPKPKRPRIYIVIDEFTSIIIPNTVDKTPFDDPEMEASRQLQLADNLLRKTLGELTGRFIRESRSQDFTLVLATQKLTSTDLDLVPGGKTIKSSTAKMLLGKASFGDKSSALKEPQEAADLGEFIPKGRGLYETGSHNGIPIQVWYDTVENLIPFIKSRRPMVTERPDFSAFDKAPKETGPAVQEVVLADLSDEVVQDVVVDDLDMSDIDLDDLLAEVDLDDDGLDLDALMDEPAKTVDDLADKLDLSDIEPDSEPAGEFDWDDGPVGDPKSLDTLPVQSVAGADNSTDQQSHRDEPQSAPEPPGAPAGPASEFSWDDEPEDVQEAPAEAPEPGPKVWNNGTPAKTVDFTFDDF